MVKLSRYKQNKLAAIYKDETPTLTDQAGAKETDVNIIVGRFLKTGSVMGNGGVPMNEDWTQLPASLRDMIHTSRSIDRLREQMPEQIRAMPIEELLALTPEQLTNILHPPAPPPANGGT